MSEVKISYKEAFTKMAAFIKTALSFEPAAAPAPAAVSVDYPIADGRVLTIDKLDLGGMVTIAGAPAPDAEYTLADGTKITVAGGLITECETPAAAATEPAVEEMKTPEQMQSALQKFADGAVAPDLQKMATIMKAVFEYCFGYEIRRKQEEATRDAAIATYQQGFAKIEAENANLKETLKTMLAAIESIGEGLAGNPLEEVKGAEELTPYQKHQLRKADKTIV